MNYVNEESFLRVPSVNLTKYVHIGSDQWRFCPVVFSSNGRPRQDRVLVNGREEHHPEGSYYIEWRDNGTRRRQSVGKSAPDAHREQEKKILLLKNHVLGIDVIDDGQKLPRITVEGACKVFLEETQQHKKSATYDQYEVALRYFQLACGEKRPLEEISRKDLLDYIAYMRNVRKLSGRTVWTKVHVVLQLLKENGRTGLMSKKDRPRYVEAEPEVYSREEVDAFLDACSAFQRTLFEFFWMTGFREQEVQAVTWNNIDFKEQVAKVRANSKYGFLPKNYEEREVPIPDRLVVSLRRHRKKFGGDCPLVFPNKSGGIERKFLRTCKTIAWRAGLNCGNCDNGKQLCVEKPCCDSWYLHKFRSTFATMHLQAGVDLSTVQLWMGHKDLASTMRYLKPARGKAVVAKVNATFS